MLQTHHTPQQHLAAKIHILWLMRGKLQKGPVAGSYKKTLRCRCFSESHSNQLLADFFRKRKPIWVASKEAFPSTHNSFFLRGWGALTLLQKAGLICNMFHLSVSYTMSSDPVLKGIATCLVSRPLLDSSARVTGCPDQDIFKIRLMMIVQYQPSWYRQFSPCCLLLCRANYTQKRGENDGKNTEEFLGFLTEGQILTVWAVTESLCGPNLSGLFRDLVKTD